MPPLFDLTSKTALVTGGSRGLGASMAIGLAESGCSILLIQRDHHNTTTRDHIRSVLGRECHIVTADLSCLASSRTLLARLLRVGTGVELAPVEGDEDAEGGGLGLEGQGVTPPSSLGEPILINGTPFTEPNSFPIPNNTIHILLNAAGVQSRHPTHLFPLTAYTTVLTTNLHIPFLLSRDISRYWLLHTSPDTLPSRTIINIASLLSYQGGLTVPAYAASKGGISQLTKAMSNELSKHGVRVNAIAPGYCATEMNTGLINDEVRSRQIMERIPMGRWGGGEDFKGVVVFLASERASGYVTGETITVDGGWMAR